MKRRFMTHAPDAHPVVGDNLFGRPSSPTNEFHRRALENAEYRAQIRCTKAVRAQHSGEQQVAAPAQPERPPEPPASYLPALHDHWLTMLRWIARIKRWLRP